MARSESKELHLASRPCRFEGRCSGAPLPSGAFPLCEAAAGMGRIGWLLAAHNGSQGQQITNYKHSFASSLSNFCLLEALSV